IRQGGTLVIGQDQDSVGGGFEAVESFQGMLSNVNLWHVALDATQISRLSKTCLQDEATDSKVYKWLDFLRQGGPGVTIVHPSPCQPVLIDNALNFPNKGVSDVVDLSGMRSLTAFTVCLWMNSSNSQGSLFSYAVSSQANEILISYNTYFALSIDGESRTTLVVANDSEWHQICLSWERSSGSWKFYKDGEPTNEGTNFKRGHTIRAGGTL
ncbi:hypothetical protein ACROYT_G009691, partial [Oculina patagonica]